MFLDAKLLIKLEELLMSTSISTILLSSLLGNLWHLLITDSVVCRVSRENYLNTEEFIDAVGQNLEAKLEEPAAV